ncbi:Alpha/Beta hydrolase protein [Auriculariales sp. MPI-PUGE-AT-0066]|nr:Alpha/Beta hydrolase protein [Auriculariales sp. MPI-PUGE-AT-0066]
MSTVYALRLASKLAVWSAKTRRVPLGLVPVNQSVYPDRYLEVDSKEGGRKIMIEVYEPPNAVKPLPVHINLHGSGFVVPLLGIDAEWCHYLSRELNCVVLDADYAKGPWDPAPHSLDDVLQVVEYAQSQPDWLDKSKLTIGGFSAGACLALLASAALPKGEIRAVAAWYPPIDLRSGVPEDVPPIAGDEIPGIGPGQALTENLVHNVFRRAYLQEGSDPSSPYLSPIMCDPSKFPPMTVVVGSKDSLYADNVAFHKKLKEAGNDIEFIAIPRAQHAWERHVKAGMPIFDELRQESFRKTVERLRAAQM